MYKCLDCGNCDKFIGFAHEEGEVIIQKGYYPEGKNGQYSWIYIVSDKSWKSDYKVKKCFFCNSTNIIKL
jgi:hypothetical protein